MDLASLDRLDELTYVGENLDGQEYFEQVGVREGDFIRHLIKLKLSLYKSFKSSENRADAFLVAYEAVQRLLGKSEYVKSTFVKENLRIILYDILDFLQLRDPEFLAKKIRGLPNSPVVADNVNLSDVRKRIPELRGLIFTDYNSDLALVEFLAGRMPSERISFGIPRYQIRAFVLELQYRTRCFSHRDNWRELVSSICFCGREQNHETEISEDSLKRSPRTPSPEVLAAIEILSQMCR